MTVMPDEAEVSRRLAEVRAKRGYLLPHHGLLAIAAPLVLAGYDATYTALTLTPRSLHERPKEFIWLGVLVACDEAIATHHIAKFRAAGGTDEEIELAIRLAAFAEVAEALSYAMFPGSIPNFVDACGVWQELIARGEVPASPAFALWGAAAAEQRGFDGA
jgi:alkylhydroperoxidase/carboxymuconolactone decarboxylase family protein YurZ